MVSCNDCTVIIAVQPKKYFYYASKSLIARKANMLVGEGTTRYKKLYPTAIFTLTTHQNKISFFVHIDLYEITESRKIRLSPDFIVQSAKGYEQWGPLYIAIANIGSTTYSVELKRYFIMRTLQMKRRNILRRKYEDLYKWKNQKSILQQYEIETIRNEVLTSYPDLSDTALKVYIGFQVYVKTENNKLEAISKLILSNPIFDGELKIFNIFPNCGDIQGGTEIKLVLTTCICEDLMLFLTYKDTTSDYIWQKRFLVPFDPSRDGKTICFCTPAYDAIIRHTSIQEIPCRIHLVRSSDNVKTNEVLFIYKTKDVIVH